MVWATYLLPVVAFVPGTISFSGRFDLHKHASLTLLYFLGIPTFVYKAFCLLVHAASIFLFCLLPAPHSSMYFHAGNIFLVTWL